MEGNNLDGLSVASPINSRSDKRIFVSESGLVFGTRLLVRIPFQRARDGRLGPSACIGYDQHA